MSARTRTCLGCNGRGCDLPYDECKRAKAHPESLCPVCLGTGIVAEPDSRKDAMVDAETFAKALRANMSPFQWRFRSGLALAGRWKRGVDEIGAMSAARAAFRAVPALKDAQ